MNLSASILAGAAASCAAVGQVSWLEPLPFAPVAVSGNGEYVIGSDPSGGLRWSRAGGAQELYDNGGLRIGAYRINYDGTRILSGLFIWNANGPGSLLLSGGSQGTGPVGVSDMSSTVIRCCGYSRMDICEPTACTWGDGGYPGFLFQFCDTTYSSSASLIAPNGGHVLVRDTAGAYSIRELQYPYGSWGYNPALWGRAMANGGVVVGSMTIGGITFAAMGGNSITNLGTIGQAPTQAVAVTADASLIVCTEGFIWIRGVGVVQLRPLLEREGLQFPSSEPIDVKDVSDDRSVFIGSGGGLTGWVARIPAICYANCDNSSTSPLLNVGDFTCFVQRFSAGDTYANCDASTQAPVLNILDFACFLQRFSIGCP
jgi:hypothetical protein